MTSMWTPFLLLLRSTLVVVLVMSFVMPIMAAATIDRTIAKLNEDLLTESDLAEVCADLEGRFRVSPRDGFGNATTETVQSMLDRTLLMQEAKRKHIIPTSEELNPQVEDMVREIRASFSSEKEFHQALVSERISLARLKDELLEKSKVDFMVFHVVSSQYSVSDQDVARFESERSAQGETVMSYRLRRLGVPVNKNGEQEAASRAREIVARIIREGISFEEGVRKYSQVPGAAQDGGDMGYMSSDKLSSAVRGAVENLETGHASKPVIAGGYANIFYLEGKRGAKSAVRERKFFEARKSLLDNLRRKANLQVYDDRLTKLLPEDYRTLCRPMTGAARHSQTPAAEAQTVTPQREQQPAMQAQPRPQYYQQPQATPTPRAGGLRGLFGRRQ